MSIPKINQEINNVASESLEKAFASESKELFQWCISQ